MTYATAERLGSLKQYLDDCANGKDTVEAWNEHRERMNRAAPKRPKASR